MITSLGLERMREVAKACAREQAFVDGAGVLGVPAHGSEAACRLDEDPELFFPIGSTGPAALQIEKAKAVCGRCPVIEVCLRWALDTQQDAGVWGGLSEDERRALKRRNARTRRAAR